MTNKQTNTNTKQPLTVVSKKDGKQLAIYNPDLAQATLKIREYQAGAVYSVLGIAYELNQISERELFKAAGFKTISEYALEVFDFKASTVSLYCNVAKTFIEDVDSMTKTIILKDNLPELTLGQLQELLPLAKQEGTEAVREQFENSNINQKMSTKDIRAKVRKMTNKEEPKPKKPVSPLKQADKVKAPTEKSTPDQVTAYVLANIDACLYALDSIAEYVKTAKVVAELENMRDNYLKD